MLLSEICVKKPVFATVLNLVLVVIGIICFSRLQIRDTPDIEFPVITISAHYAGADALYIEEQITETIERALKNLKDLDRSYSVSGNEWCSIQLVFKPSANLETALSDIRAKIAETNEDFPKEMAPPIISKVNTITQPAMWVTISSDDHDSMELTRITRTYIKNPLEKLNSVGSAQLQGGRDYSIMIEPDPIKLFQHHISPMEIEQSIRAQNNIYAAGKIKTDVHSYNLSLRGNLETEEEFKQVIIKKDKDAIIRLSDIASVKLLPAENDAILRYNGVKTIGLGITKQSKSNVLDLSKEVRRELIKIQKNLPPGVKVNVAFDDSLALAASIKSVFFTISESLILVALVTYLFIGSIRISLIPFVTIPISLIGTFSAMYYLGFSINIFTLFAMILAIGLVVDDAIVMLENVYRHIELGESPFNATLKASKEIGFAIIAMTITLAAVFLPIGFIEGFIGKLFIEFAWTLAICVLFSGFISLTLTPMMCSKMMGSTYDKPANIVVKFNQIIYHLTNKYTYLLKLAIANSTKFLLYAASSILLLILSLMWVHKSLAPNEDSGYLYISGTGVEGSTHEETKKTLIMVENILAQYKELSGYLSVVYNGAGNNFSCNVLLKDWSLRKKSTEQIVNELNTQFVKIPDMSIFATNPRPQIGGLGGGGSAIQFNLQTPHDLEKIDEVSQKFVNELNTSPIFQNVNRDLQSFSPSLNIKIDREKTYLYDSSLNDIGNTISYLIGGRKVGFFRLGDSMYDVTIKYNKNLRNENESVKNIFIKTKKDVLLPLEVFANVEETFSNNSLKHYNNMKAVEISADLAKGHKITEAIKFIDNAAKKIMDEDANDVKMEYLGEIKKMDELKSNMLSTFLFALIFIYLVLAAQFESFRDPLLILLSVPFSITGGILMLLVTGNSLNMFSQIGLITLIGLITKNAIMIVEFANQLKAKGQDVTTSVIEAATLRLRPIIMTTITTIFGALPLMFASGAGAGARSSIGLVIVGGMFIGTLFTIFVIPVLYNKFKYQRAAVVN